MRARPGSLTLSQVAAPGPKLDMHAPRCSGRLTWGGGSWGEDFRGKVLRNYSWNVPVSNCRDRRCGGRPGRALTATSWATDLSIPTHPYVHTDRPANFLSLSWVPARKKKDLRVF